MITINQIKEMKLIDNQRDAAKKSLFQLSESFNNYIGSVPILPDRLGLYVGCIVMLSLINIQVWHNKDKMADNVNDTQYDELLKLSQELNDLRNYIRNVFLVDFNQTNLLGLRAIFTNLDDKNVWTSHVVKRLQKLCS
jgi:hypothetical protein